MKIIVCGAGTIGHSLVRTLARENIADVTVVDVDSQLVRDIETTLDVKGVVGKSSFPSVLEKAGAQDADLIVAVTQHDEVNIVACQIAHSLFKVPTKIARLHSNGYLDPAWLDMFQRNHIPIDVVISPEREVSQHIIDLVTLPGAFDSAAFVEGKVMFLGTKITPECPVLDTPLDQLTELFSDLEIMVVAIERAGELFVPRRDACVMAGDEVFLITSQEDSHRCLAAFGVEEKQARRVIIVGGGRIGGLVAKELVSSSKEYRVVVVENDGVQARSVAESSDKITVLQGDGLDRTILKEAGVDSTDVVLALTDNDRVNILTCVLASTQGAQRTLCILNEDSSMPIIDSLNIGSFVDPRGIISSSILRYLRRGRVENVYSVAQGKAEVMEARAIESSSIVGKPLCDIELPEGTIIGAVVRDGKFLRPHGTMEIHVDDHVVLFTLKSHIGAVEKLFRASPDYF